MGNCFSCGKGFNGSTKDVLRLFKEDYLQRGIERYFYRLESGGDIKVMRKSQFSHIFTTQIKPNFNKGAEYAHIKEYAVKKT